MRRRLHARILNAAQTYLPFDALADSAAPPNVAYAVEPLTVGPAPAIQVPAVNLELATPPAPIFVRHPRARRYVLRVLPDGTVRITIPRWGSKREAAVFAAGQEAWIDKQRRRIEDERRQRLVRGGEERSGEAISPEAERRLRVQARRELPARLLELAAEHGLTVTRISIRNQRWRWGSCSRSGHICLNWRLVQMPPAVRDYVLIHELMHLRRMDHSKRFWKLVATACPDYKALRAWLRTHAVR